MSRCRRNRRRAHGLFFVPGVRRLLIVVKLFIRVEAKGWLFRRDSGLWRAQRVRRLTAIMAGELVHHPLFVGDTLIQLSRLRGLRVPLRLLRRLRCATAQAAAEFIGGFPALPDLAALIVARGDGRLLTAACSETVGL